MIRSVCSSDKQEKYDRWKMKLITIDKILCFLFWGSAMHVYNAGNYGSHRNDIFKITRAWIGKQNTN